MVSNTLSPMSKHIRDLVESKRLPPPSTRKVLRSDAGLTLAELASQLGVTKQALWYWEAGLRQPSGENRIAYARALDELKGLL